MCSCGAPFGGKFSHCSTINYSYYCNANANMNGEPCKTCCVQKQAKTEIINCTIRSSKRHDKKTRINGILYLCKLTIYLLVGRWLPVPFALCARIALYRLYANNGVIHKCSMRSFCKPHLYLFGYRKHPNSPSDVFSQIQNNFDHFIESNFIFVSICSPPRQHLTDQLYAVTTTSC